MNAATETPAADLLLSTRPTVAVIGVDNFNADLAKKLKGLKKAIGATSISQGYKGTGSQSHRRQIWVRAPGLTCNGVTDIWVDTKEVKLGGVMDLRRLPAIVYGERTVDEVYEAVVKGLREVIAATTH
jgi:hypothetical protein